MQQRFDARGEVRLCRLHREGGEDMHQWHRLVLGVMCWKLVRSSFSQQCLLLLVGMDGWLFHVSPMPSSLPS